MKSIKGLIRSSKEDFRVHISNILHAIKYNSLREIDYLYKVNAEDILKLKQPEFRKAVIIATCIQVSFEKKEHSFRSEAPSWIFDSRLVLEKPYISKYHIPLDLYNAYRAEYFHNVFMPKNSYDVL